MSRIIKIETSVISKNWPFPSSPGLCIITRLSAQPSIWQWFFIRMKKTHFHKKGCTLGLILKVRVFGTRKSLTVYNLATTSNLLHPKIRVSRLCTVELGIPSGQRVLGYAHSDFHQPHSVAYLSQVRTRRHDTGSRAFLHMTQNTKSSLKKKSLSLVLMSVHGIFPARAWQSPNRNTSRTTKTTTTTNIQLAFTSPLLQC